MAHHARIKSVFVLCFLLLAALLSSCGSHVYHKVRPGDTLYSVSFHYNQDYRKVALWNQIDPPYVLSVGQWLRVAPPIVNNTNKPHKTAAPQQKHFTDNGKPDQQNVNKVNTSPETKGGAEQELVSWIRPVKGTVIQRFNPNAIGKKGVAFAGMAGEPVYAAADGKVAYSGHGLRGYGNLIIIKHNDSYLSAYAHNQQNLVKDGQIVTKGQLIARMGDTDTDRVKLHFEVRINGAPVDPLNYLPK